MCNAQIRLNNQHGGQENKQRQVYRAEQAFMKHTLNKHSCRFAEQAFMKKILYSAC
jgi:hypothetical protein